MTSRWSPLILVCLAATWLIWGSTYLAIRFALVSFPPYWQMATRFLLAGLLLVGYARWRGAAWPSLRQWRNALIIGGLMLGMAMGNTARAELSVASGLIVAFVGIMPAMISVMNLAFGVRTTKLEMLGIVMGVAGVIWLVSGQGFSASPLGLLLISIATLSWSLGSVLSQHRYPLAPGAMGFASEMLCGSAVLFAMSWLAGEQPDWSPTPTALWAWLYLIVFGSLLAFTAYMVLLSRASTAVAASYTFVNPLIAMLLGVTLGHEQITHHEWYAAVVIVLAVVLLLIGKQQQQEGIAQRD